MDDLIIPNHFMEIISQKYPKYTQIYTDTSKYNNVGFSVTTDQEIT